MRQQPFARFVLLTGAACIAVLTVSIPSVISAEPTEKTAIRTDRQGDPLPKRAVMRLGTARFAQPFPTSLVFSPDGKFLISVGASDKLIRFWDPDTGKELRVLEGHTDQVNGIDLSADGKWLATGSQNYELFLWEMDTGKIRRRFRGNIGGIEHLALAPNGKVLASSCIAGTLRLWDTDTGKEIRSIPIDKGNRISAMAFTPDSKQFAFHNRLEQGIQLVDVATGNAIRSFKGHSGTIHGLTFSADGATLFSGSYDNTLRAWEVASGKEKRRYSDGKQAVSCLALSPDEKTLTYIAGRFVHIRDVATNADRGPPWNTTPGGVGSLIYSPDGRKVAIGGDRIAILDTATGKRLNPPPESESWTKQVTYSGDGKVLAVLRRDWTIELWDTARWRKKWTLRPKIGTALSMVCSPDGKYLTVVEYKLNQGKIYGTIYHWDIQTGKRHREFPQQPWAFESLTYTGAGKMLGFHQISKRHNAFVFWDAATGQERGRLPAPEFAGGTNPCPSPDGRLLAWGAAKNAVGIWDTKTGKLLHSFGDRNVSLSLPPVFSPNGRTIATPGGQALTGRIQIQPDMVLWETATGKERLHIAPNEGQLRQIVFSPDGHLLATAGQWGTIHLWDSWTGKEVGRFMGHRGLVNSLAFAPDGQTLASGGMDRTILIWDVAGLVPAAKAAAKQLSREQMARCWDDLIRLDAVRAYAAIAELARHPGKAESFLKDKLAAHTGVDSQRLARLIADLDSDDFQKREKASKELAKLGRLADAALRRTLEDKPSAELKRRIHELLDKLDPKKDDPEKLRLLRVIEVLERLGTAGARRLLRKMVEAASDPDTAREAQVSLQRLAKAGP